MLLHVIEVHLLHCWLVFNYMDIPEVVFFNHQAMQAWNFPNFLMRKKKKKKRAPLGIWKLAWRLQLDLVLLL